MAKYDINSKTDFSNFVDRGITNDLDIKLSTVDFFDVIFKIQGRDITFGKCDFTFAEVEKSPRQRSMPKAIKFSNCIFKSAVEWKGLCFSVKLPQNDEILVFENCVFEDNLDFYDFVRGTDMNNEAKIFFNNCNFNQIKIKKLKGNSSFFNINFYECAQNKGDLLIKDVDNLELETCSSKFQNIQIDNISKELIITSVETEIKKLHLNYIEKLTIYATNCHYLKIFDCKKISESVVIRDNCSYLFKEVVFDAKIEFCNNEFCNKKLTFKAESCTFNESVKILDNYRSSVAITNSTFKKLLRIENAYIEILVLRNCIFESAVKIFNLVNNIKMAVFKNSTIKGLFMFNGWNNKRLRFEENARIDFSYILLAESGYLIIRNINDVDSYNGNFDFRCANILGIVVFNDIYANKLDLLNSSITGSFNEDKNKIKDYSNSQTFVRLKNEAIKKNDTINALRYKAEEMKKYKKELRQEKRNIKERILIFLNTISNDNGQNWVRGLLFTFALAFVFCLLINLGVDGNEKLYFYWGWDGWDSYKIILKRLLAVINIFNFDNTNSEMELNLIGNFIFFISKIFVGYGIYQTISAFRKYGK